MNEIICPNCKKAFKVDEAGFNPSSTLERKSHNDSSNFWNLEWKKKRRN